MKNKSAFKDSDDQFYILNDDGEHFQIIITVNDKMYFYDDFELYELKKVPLGKVDNVRSVVE